MGGAFPPPGMAGRVEVTSGYRGEQPGQGRPLPGQARRLRNDRRSRTRRLIDALTRRGKRTHSR